MSQNDSDEIRSAAELIITQSRLMMQSRFGNPPIDMPRTHSINLITEEFLGGYMQDGRMSVVRRFFCLFVTFDLFFVSLLWLICIVINGDNIFQAFQKQIVHYTIYTSLFDVVVAAICRFIILILFYALLYVNHWFIIALSTSGSCLFLISKVFLFDWVDSRQQIFEVILIITSFVLAWGEAWFLDCRVIPQERHARRYFSNGTTSTDRAPQMAPFLASYNERRPAESVADFYSPLDSAHDTDEEEEQDEEYHQMGLDCVRKAYELLQCTDWKVEKVTKKGDTICSIHREKLGKIYKLTGRLKYSPKALCEELFYKIEGQPHWNPTMLESKIVKKINSYTDITYQATVGGGGGMIKSRDFVNLRCWRLFRQGKMCDDGIANAEESSDEEILNGSCEGSVSTVSESEGYVTRMPGSVGSCRTDHCLSVQAQRSEAFQTLSRSLGAKDFTEVLRLDFDDPPPLEEEFEDAKEHLDENLQIQQQTPTTAASKLSIKGKVWISAAISVDYNKVPTISKYTRGEYVRYVNGSMISINSNFCIIFGRGENLVAGFAMHPVDGKRDACIFEWILCLDLKGYVPRYVLDTAYTTFMTDYMTHLRKYINELRQKRRLVPGK
uniref:START domain-containing protein n=1 Tax=Glossina palpalis gambiensis TaxID=67801 RepID=A0A1B0B6G6_9MUSC